GEAIDINALENPYRLDGKVLPPAGAPYMDRADVRPGMIVAGSAPVAAFGAVHWGWGGNWSSTPDYQHFSVNGR
ncbi:MAG TPA: M15 family metallopeptidase, partial [Mycobacteriales bacterium]|nr:M15 family metallopeptidase [Mycobacteriales bacterium]